MYTQSFPPLPAPDRNITITTLVLYRHNLYTHQTTMQEETCETSHNEVVMKNVEYRI
jgi:hypothetical protein